MSMTNLDVLYILLNFGLDFSIIELSIVNFKGFF